MATNTRTNIGVRRMCYNLTPPQERCFEVGGSTVYVSNCWRLNLYGTIYNKGDALPLSVLPDEKLEVLFNDGSINPQS